MTEDPNKLRAELIRSINHAFVAPFLPETKKAECLVLLREALRVLQEPVTTDLAKARKTK